MACGIRDDLEQPTVMGADELLSRQVEVGSFCGLKDGEAGEHVSRGPVLCTVLRSGGTMRTLPAARARRLSCGSWQGSRGLP